MLAAKGVGDPAALAGRDQAAGEVDVLLGLLPRALGLGVVADRCRPVPGMVQAQAEGPLRRAGVPGHGRGRQAQRPQADQLGAQEMGDERHGLAEQLGQRGEGGGPAEVHHEPIERAARVGFGLGHGDGHEQRDAGSGVGPRPALLDRDHGPAEPVLAVDAHEGDRPLAGEVEHGPGTGGVLHVGEIPGIEVGGAGDDPGRLGGHAAIPTRGLHSLVPARREVELGLGPGPGAGRSARMAQDGWDIAPGSGRPRSTGPSVVVVASGSTAEPRAPGVSGRLLVASIVIWTPGKGGHESFS